MPWSMTLDVDGTAIPYGDSFSMTRKLSETNDWSYQSREDLRELEPDASEYANLLDENAYDVDGITYTKLLSVSGTTDAGAAWSLPAGVPDAYSYSISAGDIDGSFSWRGKGIASKLYRPHLSLPSVVSTSATKVRVRDVLGQIFDAYGIGYDVSGVSPNYVVPRMQMQDGSPIEWVRQLLEVTQAEWYESTAGSIVCFQPTWSGSGSDYTYDTDEVHIRSLSAGSSAVVDFANYVICQRADDTGGVLARADNTNATFGRQGYIAFSTPVPVNSVSWKRKNEVMGQVSDFYIYGSSPPPASPIAVWEAKGAVPPTVYGPTAYGVEFTFGAFTGGPPGATAGSYSVEFRGDNSGGVYEDSVTALVVQNTDSIESGRGRVQTTLGPNPLIADQSTLQTWGERVLYKRSRRQLRMTVTLHPSNYALRPGHVVTINDSHKGTSYRLVVLSVSHSLVADASQRLTTFEGVQYVAV